MKMKIAARARRLAAEIAVNLPVGWCGQGARTRRLELARLYQGPDHPQYECPGEVLGTVE